MKKFNWYYCFTIIFILQLLVSCTNGHYDVEKSERLVSGTQQVLSTTQPSGQIISIATEGIPYGPIVMGAANLAALALHEFNARQRAKEKESKS